jgi:hypothetical protein
MSDFKPGDRVICVNANGHFVYQRLTEGRSYEVLQFTGAFLRLTADDMGGSLYHFDPDRFRKAPQPEPDPEFLIGDQIVCIDTTGTHTGELTKGKTYEVKGIGDGGYVEIIDDLGGTTIPYRSRRFKLAQTPTPEPPLNLYYRVRGSYYLNGPYKDAETIKKIAPEKHTAEELEHIELFEMTGSLAYIPPAPAAGIWAFTAS